MVIWGLLWGMFLGALLAHGGGDSRTLILGGLMLGALMGWTLQLVVRALVRKEWAALHERDRRVRRAARGAEGEMAAPAVPSVPAAPAASSAAPAAFGATAMPPGAEPHAPAAAADWPAHMPPLPPEPPAPPAPPDFRDSFFDTPPVLAAPLSEPVAPAPEPVQPALSARTQAVHAQRPAVAQRVRAPHGVQEGDGDDWIARAAGWLLGGNAIVRIGLVILFIGLSFLVRYAAQAGLLPLPLRLLAVAATGAALLAVGWRQRLRKPGFGLSLQGAGVAVLYLTVFAAFRLGVMASQMGAFALMVLVCAGGCALALGQNARALAFLAFAGGFATPLLLSTGQGSHVALFGYYTLLGLGIAAIAARRAWRELNWLGAVSTFGIATVWGVLRYTPPEWGTAQPFLLAFMAIYVAVALLYARLRAAQETPPGRAVVDAALVFGVPLAGFALQAGMVRHLEYGAAWSALGFGVAYLVLWGWLASMGEAARWRWHLMATCFMALGVGFVTLAAPLALDARATGLAWALEGAAAFWVGVRQSRWLSRAFGLALQAVAALALLSSLGWPPEGAWPLAHPAFMHVATLALAALLCAWLLRAPLDEGEPPHGSRWERAWKELEAQLGLPLLLYGFALWCLAWHQEWSRVPAAGLPPVFSDGVALQLTVLSGLLSAALALWAAARWRWADAVWPSRLALPALWLALLVLWGMDERALDGLGPVLWPLALALQWLFMWMGEKLAGEFARRDERPGREGHMGRGAAPIRVPALRHPASVWLALLVLGDAMQDALHRLNPPGDWRVALALAACAAVLWALTAWASRPPRQWPLRPHAGAYLWTAARPLAVLTVLQALFVACTAAGNAPPLPYVPLLNPVDASVLAALGSVLLWRRAVLAARPRIEGARQWLTAPLFWAALGGSAFIAANTLWLRVAHHWFGVRWSSQALGGSFVVQAGYSLWWTLLALALMVTAHRRRQRVLWMSGAGLLGLVVLKLFAVDLANSGGGERIFAFIGVGALMLVVGYLAPLPPRKEGQAPASQAAGEGAEEGEGEG